MQETNKHFYKILLIIFFLFSVFTEIKALNVGKTDAKITIKVFSSLTCPHCASFHNEIFNSLNDDYIKKGLVKFEHHAFPLDLAALNAEIIVRCHAEKNKRMPGTMRRRLGRAGRFRGCGESFQLSRFAIRHQNVSSNRIRSSNVEDRRSYHDRIFETDDGERSRVDAIL